MAKVYQCDNKACGKLEKRDDTAGWVFLDWVGVAIYFEGDKINLPVTFCSIECLKKYLEIK